MARLGLDTSGFSAGLTRSVAEMNTGARSMGQALGHVDTHAGNLLKSSSRVGHQISNVARDLLSGADAGTVFATALEGVGRSLKLGLGAVSGLFVGGLIVGEIAKAAKEAQKLHEDIINLTRPGPDARFENLDKLIAKLEEVRKKTREVEQGPGFWGKIAGALSGKYSTSEFQVDDGRTTGAGKVAAERQQTTRDITRGHGESERLMRGIADKRHRENLEEEAPPFQRDRMKAMDDMLPKVKNAFFDKNMALVAEELRHYANTISAINRKEQEQLAKIEAEKKERTQTAVHGKADSMKLSLTDLAEHGREWAPGNDTRAGSGRLARQALKEEALSRKEMLAEHYPEAVMHQQRADQIKAGIGNLRDSDKTAPALKQAFATAEQLLAAIVDEIKAGLQ
jgi:hypothetical protein